VEILKNNEKVFNSIKERMIKIESQGREATRNEAYRWFNWSGKKIINYMKEHIVWVIKNNYNTVKEQMGNNFNKLSKETDQTRKDLGITFYLQTDKEIKIEQKPKQNILIERKQEKTLKIQMKDGRTISRITVEKCKPEKFAEIKIYKKSLEEVNISEEVDKETEFGKDIVKIYPIPQNLLSGLGKCIGLSLSSALKPL
jgi:hypothetical protein